MAQRKENGSRTVTTEALPSYGDEDKFISVAVV